METHLLVLCEFSGVWMMIHELLPLEPRKNKDVCEQVGHATLITLSNVSYTLIITAFAVEFPQTCCSKTILRNL